MKVLLMGNLYPPYSGQSVAFTIVAKQFGCNHIILNMSGRNSIAGGIPFILKIISVILFKKIDVVYFICSRTFKGSIRDIVLLLCARIKKIRTVNHLHGNDFYRFYQFLPKCYRPVVNYAYNWVDTSIVLLPAMKEQFKDFPSMKIKTIANCYASILDKLPLEKERDNNFVKLLYLSNIMTSKGIIQLLQSCENLFQMYPNLSLRIAGTFIADKYSTEKEIKYLFYTHYNSLKEKYFYRIDYKGVVSGDAKSELLWDSDIFLLPTYYVSEAFPLSIIEAMRAGNYIISTSHNLIPEIVTEENGELIEPRSPEAITAAVNKICSDRIRLDRVQNYNIKQAMEKYTELQYVQSVKNIIMDL